MNAPYQFLPALDTATQAALRSSIEKYGVLVPIVVDTDGNILDGHHRVAIARELGTLRRVMVCVIIPKEGIRIPGLPVYDDADSDLFTWDSDLQEVSNYVNANLKQQGLQGCLWDVIEVSVDVPLEDIARTLNLDRRHLDVEQRRAVVADLRQGGHSLRAIAGAVGVSKTQVQKDIKQVSTGGHLTVVPDAMPAKVTGKDGKSYPTTQAKKVSAESKPAPSQDPDKWTDAQWEKFDTDVGKALDLLLTARNCRQRGIYKPSPLVAARLALIGPADLDAELSALVEGTL